jgi:DNA-directed RNA polymerase subunit beta
MPNLLEMQLRSYRDFLQEDAPPQKRKRKGLQAVFESIFPIPDVHNLYSLEFLGYSVGKPKYDIQECRERDMTYQAPLRATLRLVAREKEAKEPTVKDVIEQTVFLGEMPLITNKGTFVVNGADRVIVSQLHRSPGVFLTKPFIPMENDFSPRGSSRIGALGSSFLWM